MTKEIDETQIDLEDGRIISIQQVVSNEGVSVNKTILLCIASAIMGGAIGILWMLV